jgi:hypothetical protein
VTGFADEAYFTPMNLADDIFDAVMSIFRASGAQAARYDLETYYVLLRQDHKLKRISEEEYQRSKVVILEVRDRLEAAIAAAEGGSPRPAEVDASPGARVVT